MPRKTVEIIAATDGARDHAPVASPNFEAHLGFLVVVIAPALFWAAVVFGASYLAGLSSAPQLGLAVFAAASTFLTFISRALRVRL